MSTHDLGNGLSLVAHALSHVGCVRTQNQDSIGILDTGDSRRGHVLTVADGMGGAVGGEIASRMTIDAVHRVFVAERSRADAALADAVCAANDDVYTRTQEEPGLAGMGTTCTTIAVSGKDYFIAHVGDSRCYLVEPDRLRQLTTDHSLAAEMRRQAGGELEVAVPSNILSRCVGVESEVEVDIVSGRGAVEPGLTFVLCSDGLTGMVTDEKIHAIVRRQSPEIAVRDLVQAALNEGAPDNVSAIVASIVRS